MTLNELKQLLNEKKENLNTLSIDFMKMYDLDSNSCIEEGLFEFSDSMVDIYYYELKQWLRENEDSIEYMERVIEEGLIDTRNYDFYKHIQCAQFEQIREAIAQDMTTIIECLALEHLINNYEALDLEYLDFNIEVLLDELNFHYNDRFYDFVYDIQSYLEDLREDKE